MHAKDILIGALETILARDNLEIPQKHVVNPPKDTRFGDLSTNVAMLLAKQTGKNPRALAKELAEALVRECPDIASAEAAGPGFCNVTFRPGYWQDIVKRIEKAGPDFGHSSKGADSSVLVEYVSANPTGPLHVGHGRGAAYGDSVARILRSQGWKVGTEYYLNDAGLQMRTLGLSILLRARELAGQETDFPKDCYQGDYIVDLAREITTLVPDLLEKPEEEARAHCQEFGMVEILGGIKSDLAKFHCEHQLFFSEKSLVDSGAVSRAFAALDKAGHTFYKDGAYWFRTTAFGDDRDRVLRKSDGSLTYFATDIAYHHDKFERGYDWLVDVWGADHHGYIPRMRAAIEAMGRNADKFDVALIQLVNLLRDNNQVSMSTRAGTFVTLEDVVNEVGVDAARFMFLSRKSDSPLDFDLELAKERSMENPVYYVQYAHARIQALMRRAKERGIELADFSSPEILARLDTPEDQALLCQIALYEEMLANAARDLAPHYVSNYLRELAALLHSYYAKHQIILPEDQQKTLARLALSRAVGQVINNGLFLLGVDAPEQM